MVWPGARSFLSLPPAWTDVTAEELRLMVKTGG